MHTIPKDHNCCLRYKEKEMPTQLSCNDGTITFPHQIKHMQIAFLRIHEMD